MADRNREKEGASPDEGVDGWLDVKRRISRFFSVALEDHPAALLTAVGATVYAVVRYAYVAFYGRLGVEPEELGLGYGEVLVRLGTRLLLNFLLMLAVAWFALFLIRRVRTLRARRTGKTAPGESSGLTIIGVTALLVFFNINAQTTRLQTKIACGDAVRPTLKYITLDNPLEIRAEPVRVVPLAANVEKHLSEDDEYVYLGKSNGTVVLYRVAPERDGEVGSGRTVRVPESGVLLISPPIEESSPDFAREYLAHEWFSGCPD